MGVELKAPSSAVMIRSGLSGANLRNSFARVYAARPLPTITTLLIQFPPKKYGPIARRALLRHFDERVMPATRSSRSRPWPRRNPDIPNRPESTTRPYLTRCPLPACRLLHPIRNRTPHTAIFSLHAPHLNSCIASMQLNAPHHPAVTRFKVSV